MRFLKILWGKRDTLLDDEAAKLLIHQELKSKELEKRVEDLEQEQRLTELRKRGNRGD